MSIVLVLVLHFGSKSYSRIYLSVFSLFGQPCLTLWSQRKQPSDRSSSSFLKATGSIVVLGSAESLGRFLPCLSHYFSYFETA